MPIPQARVVFLPLEMLPNVLCDYLVEILIREHRQTSYIGDEIGEVVLSKINVQVSRCVFQWNVNANSS